MVPLIILMISEHISSYSIDTNMIENELKTNNNQRNHNYMQISEKSTLGTLTPGRQMFLSIFILFSFKG